MATRALVIYDYLTTIKDERQLLWEKKGKINGGTVIFVLNRYITLFSAVLSGVSVFPNQTHKRYVDIQHDAYADIFALFSAIAAACKLAMLKCALAVFASLRIYAIWHGNLAVTLLMGVLHSAPLIVRALLLSLPGIPKAAYLYFKTLVPIYGCFAMIPSKPMDPTLYAVAYFGFVGGLWLILSESVETQWRWAVTQLYCGLMVFAYATTCVLTWIKTYRLSRQAKAVNISASLSGMLLRDGSILFVVVTLMNVAETTWLLIAGGDVIYSLVVALVSVLISHFMFNLHRASEHHAGRSVPSAMESAVFAARSGFSQVIGNLGNSVNLGVLDDDSISFSETDDHSHASEHDVGDREKADSGSTVFKEENGSDKGERPDRLVLNAKYSRVYRRVVG
ncbi:hypothetical protein BXZ70DRAFT_1006201 [Cristinia sonorae]|uniref:DUF6533 domain-containing protein n=1 Tax=Cristinia sonorae TaxID=1940300 RepID=A0A8K0UTX4_9AGAR|nr:hypothetical protein BXZ70DRAFT_1006201 [Cristinia sonorae]